MHVSGLKANNLDRRSFAEMMTFLKANTNAKVVVILEAHTFQGNGDISYKETSTYPINQVRSLSFNLVARF